jgi:hypothetical protein
MKSITIISILIICSSCTSSKWKTAYIEKNAEIIKTKYAAGSEFDTKIGASQFANKSYAKLTRKDVKKNIRGWEKVFALVPDSIYTSGRNIDSFYSNKNKITYIKKNKLKTNSIHF